MTVTNSALARDVATRRTFAIISHPDAGKTTLTEKLLLFGGAIQLAGAVKGRKAARHATSDWMEVEKQRGISVTSSVMQFDYNGRVINLLDTPGHQDFSEDTYRVLTAVDAAVMVIDAAKGVEAQTIKLLEICRLRNTPIITFINKMDRPGADADRVLGQIRRRLSEHAAFLEDTEGLLETVADLDEKVMEAYLEGKEPGREELLEIFRENALQGRAFPVLKGSALTGEGVDALLDAEEFYGKCHFSRLIDPEPGEETVLMFFDLKGIK